MKKNSILIYTTASLISLFFSYWFAVRESVINPDAICYLQSAESMRYGLFHAMHLCDQAVWPFYSALIYGVVTLTHVSFQTAAYGLDGLFSLISVITFIAIVDFIANVRITSILCFAAFVILFAHDFNSVRQYIIRDHGYWAFYLLSIYFLLRYFHLPHFRFAFLWSASLCIATLFRVEGAIFLLFIPFVSLFNFGKAFRERLQDFFKLNTLTFIAAVILVIGFLLHTHFDLSRLNEIDFQFLHGGGLIKSNFMNMKNTIANSILNSDSAKDAGVVLTLMLVSWYLVSVLSNVSLIFALLVIYAWSKKLVKSNPVLWGYLIINLVITVSFLAEHLFLSKRYVIGLSLVLMLWVPFALNDLLMQWRLRRLPLAFATLFVLVSAFGGILDFGYSKRYIHDAGDWLAVNVPQQATLYSDDFQTMYYSHHFGENIFNIAREFIKPDAIKQWQNYEYLAIRTDKKALASNNTINQITYPLVKIFQNKRGDQVRIYERGQS